MSTSELRAIAAHSELDGSTERAAVLREAADKIERLQGQIAAVNEPALAVNAYDGDDGIIIALRDSDANWHTWMLTERDAVQLADQLRLLTRTTD